METPNQARGQMTMETQLVGPPMMETAGDEAAASHARPDQTHEGRDGEAGASGAAMTHELRPLGAPTGQGLDAATWAGQSLVVAVVLGGIALIAYALKRRQLSKSGGAGQMGFGHIDHSRDRARPRIMPDADREDDEADGGDGVDAGEAARDGAQGFAYVGMGATSALRDEVAALRAEIESTRDEAAALRREVAALRAMIERGTHERGVHEREGTPRRGARGEPDASDDVAGESTRGAGVPSAFGDARIEIKPGVRSAEKPAPKPEARESVEQRVLAMAARGESVIAIAQRTGVPTGQVELMLNLARASGRV